MAVLDRVAVPPARIVRKDRLAVCLLIASVAAALVAAFVYLLMIRTGVGQRLDNAAYLGSKQTLPQTRQADATWLQRITGDSLAVVLVVIAGIGLVRRRVVLGVAAAASALIAVVGTDLIKHHVLTRPFLVRSDYLTSAANTFPSGHTATAIACALALLLVVPPRWRGVAAVVAGSYSWLVAARVQTAGWHRPSDAVGGALVAFTAVTFVAAVVAWRRPVASVSGSRHWIAFGILGLVWLYSAAVTARTTERVVRFLATQPDARSYSAAIQADAYRISVNLTVTVVATLLIVLLLLVGRRDLDAPAISAG